MKYKEKYRRIPVLMIISQLLLTVFVMQWLRSQYNAEKERLELDLTALYFEAQDEMIDTILFRSYVGPVLSHRTDTSMKNITGVVQIHGGNKELSVRINRQADSENFFRDTFRIRKTSEDMLLRSVKLIISHSSDSLHPNDSVPENLNIVPDTGAFKIHFIHRLKDAGFDFNLAWKGDSLSLKRPNRTLIISPHNPFSLPAVNVKDYNGYLTGKLWPQILFGIVLVCLTAFSFILSYRSLRDHVVVNELRNEFISNMTHELKTPVATIGLVLESLGKFNMKDDPRIADEYLGLAVSETKRLEDLVNRVLDHSMLEEKIRGLEIVDTDLGTLISDVVAIMQPRIAAGGQINYISHEELRIKCDPLLLKGVILNLVDNSLKYTDKTPEINIRATAEATTVRIEVSDNGPGIPAEYRKRIFEKFFRIPSDNVHNVKGYGLGLSYASLVMKLHNGSIAAEDCDTGCTIVLKIPMTHA